MRKLTRPSRPIVLGGSFRIIFIALMAVVVWREIRRDAEDAFL